MFRLVFASPHCVLDPSSGAAVATLDALEVPAHGKPSAADRFKFTAREFDAAIEQYYYRARYYDARIGRFTSEDPLGLAAGDANVFRYVGNLPTGRIDPAGQAEQSGGATRPDYSDYPPTLPRYPIVGSIRSPSGGPDIFVYWSGYPTTHPGVGRELTQEQKTTIALTVTMHFAPFFRGREHELHPLVEKAIELATRHGVPWFFDHWDEIKESLGTPPWWYFWERITWPSFPEDPYFMPCKCFAAGTLVQGPRGARPIETVKVGEPVFAFDVAAGKTVVTRVAQVERHLGNHQLLTIDTGRDHIQVTTEHPMFDGERWFSSRELLFGGRLFSVFLGVLEVGDAPSGRDSSCITYNLRTPEGTYLVGAAGIVVGDRPIRLRPSHPRALGCRI